MGFPLPTLALAILASIFVTTTLDAASRKPRSTNQTPLVTEIQLRSGEKKNATPTQFFADGVLVRSNTESTENPPPPPTFIPWGNVDLDWLQAENPSLKPPRAISTYGGEKLDARAVWIDVTRDEGVAPRDTALRINLRRTTGNEGDIPIELECIFLKPDDSHFAIVTRRITPLTLPLGQSTSVWCAPKHPLLSTRRTLPPPAKSYKRPLHWIVRVRSHRQIIATVTSDRAIATWAETAHMPDPQSPFGGTWRNYGQ